MSGANKTVANLKEERDFFSEIGSWLWAPLDIPQDRKQLLILPDGRISNLPWLAVIHEKEPLATKHELVLSPSLRHHLRAAKGEIRSRKIDVFVGEVSGLRHTRRELELLSSSTQPSISVYDPCRRQDWSRNGDAWIWHYTGHADFRNDNPFYSSLMLADGPMFAADFRLKRNAVGVVTLAACRTAGQSIVPGEESTGLVRSLLEMGARNVVASHWSVADESTSIWMKQFYQFLFDGHSVGESARLAALHTQEQYPSAYDWAAFSVFGSG
jgi:CHAT domain-containing protein